jgi:branched-chain amino acid transport system substrate-binding protein
MLRIPMPLKPALLNLWRPRAWLAAATLVLSVQAAAAEPEVLIGASIPLSGSLASFGSYEQWGYNTAVNDLNKAGGLMIGGQPHKVRLIVLDDKTDPSVTQSNTETLISRDKVVAMLGSCTPALVNAGALVAERHKIPMVTPCDPLMAFKSVRPWKYVWDIFFEESDLGSAPFRMLADLGIQSNRRAVILHDNGPDGQVVGGQIWPEVAAKSQIQITQNSAFPVDNSQFTSVIGAGKSNGADLVLVDAITPAAIAIRKQLAAAGYQPKVLVIEKGAEPQQFAQALGALADGVLVGGYWDPSFPYPGAADLAKRFESETHQSSSQHIADTLTAAQVLLDAIAAAGSTDPESINAALARTNKSYVTGPVKFDAQHASALPIVLMQWQKGHAVVVWPKNRANGTLLFPLP